MRILFNSQGIPAMNVEAGECAVESRRGSISIPIMGEPAGADHLEPAAGPISAPSWDRVPVIKINVIISFGYVFYHHVHHGGSSITLAPKGGLTLQPLPQANCDNLLSTT